MALYNIKKTYIVIMENIEIFNLLLDTSNEVFFDAENPKDIDFKKTNAFKNLFFMDTYNNILEKYVDEMPQFKKDDIEKAKGVAECLSYEHLLEKNIIHSGEKENGRTTFSIAKHLLEIIKDIYKEKSVPLNNTEYRDFEILLKNYANFFRENIHLNNNKDIVEKKLSLENLLEDVHGKILSSISTLDAAAKHSFSKNEKNTSATIQDVDTTKKKLKQAKQLQETYVAPLYRFTNRKSSVFMTSLDSLRVLFEKHNRHFELEKTISHYFLQYLLVSKKIKPIKDYIISYVRQNERNLYRNVGNERSFTRLYNFIEEHSLGQTRKNKIWYSDTERLMEICSFFTNTAENWKDTNIKEHQNNRYFLERVTQHINEELDNYSYEQEVKTLINKEYEKIMKNKEEENKRKEINKNINKLFKQYLKHTKMQNQTEIVPFIAEFLKTNETTREHWNIGHLQSLTKHFTVENMEKIILVGDFDTIERKNAKTKYQKIVWRDNQC